MTHVPLFNDRRDAGRRLATLLAPRFRDDDVVVLALPLGGLAVADEVARELQAPMDVLFVRKLGAPGFPELGLGAVVDGEHPQRIVNQSVIDAVQPPPGYLDAEERRQLAVIEERRRLYRHGRPPAPIEARTAIVVDDGIATGGTVRAALQALARTGARRTVLATPVAPRGVLEQLPVDPQDIVCLHAPDDFIAVGFYYRDFSDVSEEEAVELLDRAYLRANGAQPRVPPPPGAGRLRA
jgi:putative phosphoribosyl transferase